MTRLTPEAGFAVVTGAGSGLGRALSRALCARGFIVAGFGRRAEALAKTADGCAGRFDAVPVDVADADAVAIAINDAVTRHGRLALLINNAAIYPRGDFLSAPAGQVMAATAVNLGGVVACSHAALLHMAQHGHGRILNVATFADLNPMPGATAYSVSKGAARIFTRALIADVCDRFPGIVISDWMPGMLDTGMGIPDGLDPEKAAEWGVSLALETDPAFTGSVFEMDREVLPPRSLKRRLKDLVLRTGPKARRIG